MSRIHQSLGRTKGVESVFDLALPEKGSRQSAAPLTAAGRFRTAALHIPAGLPLLPFGDSQADAAEQYRILRTNIRQFPGAPKVIAVSSPMPGDGKTVTAINISAILAMKDDTRVLLIDGDLRQRAVSHALGLEIECGLSDLITGDCKISDAIVQTDLIPNLHVLTAGAVGANPAELLDSDAFRLQVDSLRDEFTYIIFDTTPIAVVADYKLIQTVCDGSIFVVRPDSTDRSELMKALAAEPRQKLMGLVINAFQDWFLYKQSSGYYYRRPKPAAGNSAPKGQNR